MKFFDFGEFQKIMKMLSREKIIFHMLFGASHGTPRIVITSKDFGGYNYIDLQYEILYSY